MHREPAWKPSPYDRPLPTPSFAAEPMAKFFLSYRRRDTGQAIGRIYERIAGYFGEDSVFVDLESIKYAEDFRARIEDEVAASDALVVIMGARWLEHFGESGRVGESEEALPEAPPSEDYVKIEIEAALQHALPVLPVLVGGAPMPAPGDLPETISELAYRNALPLDMGREFDVHMRRLLHNLDAIRVAGTHRRQPIQDPHLISALCKELMLFLKYEWSRTGAATTIGVSPEFRVYGTHDFQRPMHQGVSLFLHRVVQDANSLVELHFILTAWGIDAESQHVLLGWLLGVLRENPVVPLDPGEPEYSPIPAGITIRLFPSQESAREIWRDVTGESYQISVSYVLRATY